MLTELDASVVAVTTRVFQTMMGWQTVPADDQPGACKPEPFELAEINGWVGFGGKLAGSLFLCCTDRLGGRIGQGILGQECSPAEISDVIGEVTNMLAGGIKSRLCDQGVPVVISIPNIIRGGSIRAAGRDIEFMVRRRFQLPVADAAFQVVVQGKPVN